MSDLDDLPDPEDLAYIDDDDATPGPIADQRRRGATIRLVACSNRSVCPRAHRRGWWCWPPAPVRCWNRCWSPRSATIPPASSRSGSTGTAGRSRSPTAASVPSYQVRLGDYQDREAWDAAITDATAAHEPDWVVSAGFMKILGPQFLSRFPGRVINTHPALLPSFPGAHAVAEALAYGVKVTGCSVHLVDAGTDTGPILAQQAVPVLDDDDEATLHERIKVVERRLLVDVLAELATRGVTWSGRKATIG